MAFTSRLYAGDADLQAMIALMRATRPPEHFADYPSLVDLQEKHARPGGLENTLLWHGAQGQLVAYALVDVEFCNLCLELTPPVKDTDAVARTVEWAAARVRQAHPDDDSLTLDANCRDDDAERSTLLEQHGFVRQDLNTLEMVRHLARPLGEPIPVPSLPPGFCIRPVLGEQEVEALTALHRAAFGTDKLTTEERRAWMQVPEYDPELDLVAVAPDGVLAAYCLCQISREENARTGRNEGHTDPVATHPAFQGRGLARALLLTGMVLLKQRGMDTAVLGTSSENVAMQRAAASAGFCVRAKRVWFAKPLARPLATI